LVKIDREAKALAAVSAALGFVAALTLSAPMALADPLQSEPVTPVASPATPVEPVPAGPAPVAAATDPVIGTPAPTPAPDGTVQPVAVLPATPPNGMPHLSSPENLPPGTTDAPTDDQGNGVSYLRDIWHAYQTQEVDGKGALLLLTQRPMDADAVPPPGMSANPTPPLPPGAPLPPDAAPPEAPAVP
jgi:resuscitation-promoting factor RpfA